MSDRGRGARADAARWVVVALLLVAVALRIFRLADADIWWDEGLAVWATRQGIAEATRWTAGDVHPPLFFWSLRLWLRLVGDDPFALRLVVVFTGVVLTALAWPLGRRLAGTSGGVLAVAAVATSRFLVWWSMELRMYALAGACLMAATLGMLRWLEGRRRGRARWDLALYVVGATGALHSVYLAGAGLVALNVVVGWALMGRRVARRFVLPSAIANRRPKALTPRPSPEPHRTEGAAGTPSTSLVEGQEPWRRIVEWSLAQVAVLVAFAPWAIYAGGRMSSWRVVQEGPSLWFTVKLWLTLLATGVSTDIDSAWPWVAAFAIAIAIAWLVTQRVGHPSPLPTVLPVLPVLVALLLIPPLSIWAITQPRSFFYSPNVEARYFAPFAAPALVVVAAIIARAATRHRSAWGLAILVLAPSLVHLPAYYAPRRATDTIPTMALAVWSQAEPGDVVLLVSGNRYPLWLYHYDRAWEQPLGNPRYEFPADAPPRWADRPPVVLFPDRGSETLAGHDDWQAKLDGIVDAHPRVWLVEYGRDLQDPKDEVEAWLAGRLKRVLSEGYGADALHLFARDDREPAVRALSARWPGATLLHSDPALRRARFPNMLTIGFRPARRAYAGEIVNATLFPMPETRTSLAKAPDGSTFTACQMKVVSTVDPGDGYYRADWTMSATANVTDVSPRRRVRASLWIDDTGHRHLVEVSGCGEPWLPIWPLDVLRR
ncbi:MAG: glycosyltransferase family 39 protein [Ardenticatenales bacterium]|nr:glycosyltransferase family 39 protein [Ardenticatenales bacterium]